jgi:hypothetical protein
MFTTVDLNIMKTLYTVNIKTHFYTFLHVQPSQSLLFKFFPFFAMSGALDIRAPLVLLVFSTTTRDVNVVL